MSYRGGSGEILTLSERTHHLGVAGRPEWNRFKAKKPESESLDVHFTGRKNASEFTLLIRQDDVKQDWAVTLNGKKLGQLFLMEADLVQCLPVPPGSLVEGDNLLSFSTKVPEDILIHSLALADVPKEQLLRAGPVTIKVTDAASGESLPARVTITDRNGSLAPIFDFGATNLASRPGVVYTANGLARLKLLPGEYTIYATRGPEYSVAKIGAFNPELTSEVKLSIRRAADTRGWVAADTHIHTLTLSRHGDASLRERVITIAGEAIELAVCTEHNTNANYSAAAKQAGLDRYFTPVAGNEVTTKRGHFNVFPVEAAAKAPDATLESWPALMREMRGASGARTVVLNHPLDSHAGFTPFAITNLHILTGRNLLGSDPFEFDAMEVINSGAMRTEWGEPFRAWFALLNRGLRITAVGASDSHDVSRFIVGQGRTYIKVDDSDPSKIDVEKAGASLKSGHAVVSLGLFPQLTIADAGRPERAAGPGDLLSAQAEELELTLTVSAPLTPDRQANLTIVANGNPVKEFYAVPTPHTFRLKRPAQDTYYVFIADIPGDVGVEWGLARPYQPSSPRIDLKLLGVTNPVWVDVDGDGKFTSPREYAQKLVDQKKPLAEAMKFDHATLWQYAELARLTRASVTDALGRISPPLNDYFSVEEMIARSQHLP